MPNADAAAALLAQRGARPCRRSSGSPTSWPPWAARDSAASPARRQRMRGQRGPAAEQATTPPGPSTTRSASAASPLTSAEALHTVSPGYPVRAQRRARRRRPARSPRSSPQNSTAPGLPFGARLSGPPPCPARRPQLDDQPARLHHQPGPSGQPASGPAQAASAPPGRRPAGYAPPARRPCPRSRSPRARPAAASTPGSRAGPPPRPAGRGGAVSVPACQRSRP